MFQFLLGLFGDFVFGWFIGCLLEFCDLGCDLCVGFWG